MRHNLLHEAIRFHYSLLNASEVDYRQFLNSTVPEEILLTVLGDFKQTNADEVIESVMARLSELVPRSLRLKRYIKQLEILSQLRNLQQLVINVSEKMALVYNLENDIRFKQGEERGEARGEARGRNEAKDQLIGNMLRKCLLTHEQIAEIAEVPVDRVKAMAHQVANQ